MNAASKVTFGKMEIDAEVAEVSYMDITVGDILVGWIEKTLADDFSAERYELWLEVDELRDAGLVLNSDATALWRPYASLDDQGNGSVSRSFWVPRTGAVGSKPIQGRANRALKEAKDFARQIVVAFGA